MNHAPVHRHLGSFDAHDLGLRIKEPPLPPNSPLRRKHRPLEGTIESVHHFRVNDEDWSSVLIKVPLTARQVKDRVPAVREVRALSNTPIEVLS